MVINDYEKAKSLFGNTEVPVFKKGIFYLFNFFLFFFVLYYPWTFFFFNDFFLCAPPVVYAEVETRIEALRSLLLDKLLQTPSTLHDQKRYIRCEYSKPDALQSSLSVALKEAVVVCVKWKYLTYRNKFLINIIDLPATLSWLLGVWWSHSDAQCYIISTHWRPLVQSECVVGTLLLQNSNPNI